MYRTYSKLDIYSIWLLNLDGKRIFEGKVRIRDVTDVDKLC